jgi:hypothetical protein
MRLYVKLAVVLLVAIALVQGVFWYAASRWFAQLAHAVSPVAELGYRSSFGWPNGRIGIRDVRLRPRAAPGEEIAAERLTLDFGGPLPLLGLLFARADQEPAERFGVHVRRARISLGLERAARGASTRLGYLAPYEAVACNNADRFTGADYAELGWLQSQADLDADLRFDAARKAVEAKIAYDLDPLGRVELDLLLSGMEPAVLARTGAIPRIERLNAGFQDRGMMAQRNAYCARRLGIPEDAFVARHIDAVRGDLEARGIFVDPSVLATYQAFAARGGLIEFLATPNAGFALSEYRHYRWNDQLKMLNANLRHDRGALVPITASFYAEGAGLEGDVPVAGESVSVRVSASDLSGFDMTDLDELAGERVRLRTVHGTVYVGKLLDVQGGMLRMEVEQRGTASPRRTAVNIADVVNVDRVD